MARPTKRSPEIEQAILASLQIGNTREDSALAVGIDRVTLWRWIKEATFRNAVEKAEAMARQRFVGQIAQAAANGNWQAAAWNLERRDHEHWGRRDRVDMVLDVRKAIEGITSDPAEVEAAVAEAKRLMGVR
jgi:hypothetical protein